MKVDTVSSISALDIDNSVSHSSNAERSTYGNTEMTDEDLEELFSNFTVQTVSDDIQDSGVSPNPERTDKPAVSLELKKSIDPDLDELKSIFLGTDIKMSANYYGSSFDTVSRRAKIDEQLTEFDLV